ncbi:hypothetical protein DFH09DRAFT_1083080 [Mycena vulgaris]|nr:hypothetical protein DFH09DRAFT_1083080 [Mycena vulgaris]
MSSPNPFPPNPGVGASDLCPDCLIYPLTRATVATSFHTPEHNGRYYQKVLGGGTTSVPTPGATTHLLPLLIPEACIGHLMSCAKIRNVLLSHTAPKQDLETCNALSCFLESPPSSSSSPHISPSHPTSYGPYGRMVAPNVANKLRNHDFSLSPSHRGQKEAYRMEASYMINIRWWAKDYELPALMAVPAPGFPWWHPKESQAVRERVQLPCEVYEYLELTTSIEFTLEEDDRWILTPGPIRVKPDCTLYLRSPGVTVCPGLRAQPQKKHPLSRDAPVTPTPKDIKNKSLPEPAQKRRQVIELSDSEDDLDLPPQPVFSLSQSAWPLMYACDMDLGFKQMVALDGKPSIHFKDVFGSDWHSSTYSDNVPAWRGAPKPFLAAAIRAGHSSVLHFRLPPVSPPIASLKTLQLLLSSHAPHIVDISILVSLPIHPFTSKLSVVDNRRDSQKGLTLQRLRAILRKHLQVASLPSTPNTKPTARRAILSHKISVDWSWISGDQQEGGRAVDCQFRKWLLEKVIKVPEATSGDESSDLSVLTATPDHLKGMLFDKPLLDDGSSSLDDFPLPGIEEDVGPGGLPNTMDVDPTVEEPMDVSSDGEEGKLNGAHDWSDWNEDDEFDPKFWNLLASTPEDKVDPGQVRLIIFNYARDGVKAIPYFHPDVFRPEEYGPEGTERWYLDTQDVFKILEEANALPEPPWLCKWSLSGFPWVVGPIAFQLSAETEVQLDLSKRRTEAITVNGPPDTLRALLCFLPITDVELKEFTAKMTADIEMVDAKLDDGMLDDLLEIEVKPEIDVKPDIRLTSRSRDQKKSEATQAKDAAMVAWLESKFLHEPKILHCRNVPLPRGKHPAPDVVAWIDTVAAYVTAHKRCMDPAFPEAYNAKISPDHWGHLFNRAGGWVKSCITADPYIKHCSREADIALLIQNEKLMVGVSSLVSKIEKQAFQTVKEWEASQAVVVD